MSCSVFTHTHTHTHTHTEKLKTSFRLTAEAQKRQQELELASEAQETPSSIQTPEAHNRAKSSSGQQKLTRELPEKRERERAEANRQTAEAPIWGTRGEREVRELELTSDAQKKHQKLT